MHQKTISACLVHVHCVGTVSDFIAVRAARVAQSSRRKNLRDVVGAAQTPSIRDIFVGG